MRVQRFATSLLLLIAALAGAGCGVQIVTSPSDTGPDAVSIDGGLIANDASGDAGVDARMPDVFMSDVFALSDAPTGDAFSPDAFSLDAFSLDAFSRDASPRDAFAADTLVDGGMVVGGIDLRTASSFAVLAGSTVTSTGGTMISGDLGVSPGMALVGFPPASLVGTFQLATPIAAQAKLDLTTAFNDAAARSTAPISVSGNLGGMTLAPGLYRSTSSLEISSGALTLDGGGNGNAVWIFQMASTFTMGTGRAIILAGGARAANIYWQVGTSATIGPTSMFAGNILADQSITLETGARVDGRVLTRIGAVTLDSNVIVVPAP